MIFFTLQNTIIIYNIVFKSVFLAFLKSVSSHLKTIKTFSKVIQQRVTEWHRIIISAKTKVSKNLLSVEKEIIEQPRLYKLVPEPTARNAVPGVSPRQGLL